METGVAAEYTDGITSCPVCGAGLVAILPDASDELIPCLTIGDASLVPYVKSILDGAGVPYLIKHEGVQNLVGWGTAVFGFNPITGPPVVMVETSRLDEATKLLEPIAAASSDRATDSVEAPFGGRSTPTICAHCGGSLEAEEGGAALSDCYHCGWPL
jgi:hypothetical protein